MNSSVDLHQNVKMKLEGTERKGIQGTLNPFDETMGSTSINQNTFKRMSRREYETSFENSKLHSRLLPFHPMNILQIDDHLNNTTQNQTQRDNFIQGERVTGYVSHRNELTEKINNHKKRMNTTSVKRRARISDQIKHYKQNSIIYGNSDYSILYDNDQESAIKNMVMQITNLNIGSKQLQFYFKIKTDDNNV